MAKLKIYDIGRADCILIWDDESNSERRDNRNERLMIDCGIAEKNTHQINIVNKDLDIVQINNLLITHFHKDHYGGLYYIDKYKFDTIYLSKYLECIFSISMTPILVSFLKLYYLANPKTLLKNNLHFILNYLYVCAVNLKTNGIIRYVNQGSVIPIHRGYKVLWPNINCLNLPEMISHTKNEITEYLEDNEDLINTNELNRHIESYIEVASRMNNIFNKDEPILKKRFEKIGKDMSEILNDIDLLRDNETEPTEQYRISKIMSDFHNKLAIVIHDAKGLYLSDVEKSTVKGLRPVYNNNYSVVKTPHHGSHTHFSLSIPSKSTFVSCSNSSRDINTSNPYFSCFPNAYHIFSNGDCFVSGRLISGHLTPNIVIGI
ncbi:MAG: MBL fold metallo-hydrolase [Candidatus Izemoplasmatales bacterium]|nr:MBL fold metallo-hydrolase [Candidatus Izemoplasmatales bacterium]